MERRHSNTSDSSTDSTNGRQPTCNNSAETPLGRIAKVTTPKPSPNALQFVKTGPADLYRSAQEQLKKVEEIKKAKKHIPEEAEDWQSNLDNWKCSRRKRQEHIIERVVEVKKLELEEHERNKRRSKTFSEMIHERNIRGIKTNLPLYHDDDSSDLFDLGITSATSEENTDQEINNDIEEAKEDMLNGYNLEQNDENDKVSMSHCVMNGISTPVNGDTSEKDLQGNNDIEEYTYERAIQGYVNFAETRVKSRSAKNLNDEKKQFSGTSKDYPPVPIKPRRSSTVENSSFDIHNKKPFIKTEFTLDTNRKLPELPKVDISKRKELFEKADVNEVLVKPSRSSADVTNGKSIKDRLSSLKEINISIELPKTQNSNKLSTEISVKERLTKIEKLNSDDKKNSPKWKSTEQLTSQTIKDRLCSLEKVKNCSSKTANLVESNISIKERLSSLHSSVNKEQTEVVITNGKSNTYEELEVRPEECFQIQESFERSFSPGEIFDSKRQQHYRHRSLDSLDVDSNSNDTFERVQSLEDLEYCRNYPASTFSGDTDREDSGIHTADVSSSVSQADDYDLHLDTNGVLDDIKANHQPTIIEEIKLCQVDATPNSSYVFENSCHIQDVSPVSMATMADTEDPSAYSSAKAESVSSPVKSEISFDLISVNTSSHKNELGSSVSSPLMTQGESTTVNNLANDTSKSLDEQAINHFLTNDVNKIEEKIKRREVKSFQNPENRRTVVEYCSKMDTSELKSPPVTPFISVDFPKICFETSDSTLITNPEKVVSEQDKTFCLNDGSPNISPSSFTNGITYEQQSNLGKISELDGSSLQTTQDLFERDIKKGSHTLNGLCTVPSTNISVDQQLFAPPNDLKVGELFVNLAIDQEVEGVFQLSPTTLEPPKEKPPPPPTDISDDEMERTNSLKSTSLRRLDSTKRIKKEIRQKRSSFLGIDGNNDESYLDPELELIRPPDMTTLLAEERRMERQLYRQSVCSESDSNQESRDSGVELDNKNHEIGWSHSRNDSEIFGNQSITSEEDEIMRKEREIIETLEQEERIRKQDLGEKLAHRLRQLEAEKGRNEWERLNQNDVLRDHLHLHMAAPEHSLPYPQEIFHCEQERLHSEEQHAAVQNQWYGTRASLQDISHSNQQNNVFQEKMHANEFPKEYRNSLQDLTDPGRNRQVVAHGRSMPDLQTIPRRPPPPPPPVLPAKPKPLQVNTNDSQCSTQQMSRQTLHALSAAPRSRIIGNDTWQTKRKPRQDNYNYQHWLIQEAEHRRITEQHQRQSIPPSRSNHPKPVPIQWSQITQQSYPSHPHQSVYTSIPPSQPQWNGQHRDTKPLPDSIIQTLTQRVQNRLNVSDSNNNNRRYENQLTHDNQQEKMLSVSGKKRCSHCGDELGRGAAMIIESLRLFYHIDCFKCCVCYMQLGDGLMGTDVRVRNNKLHCHNCYSSDDVYKLHHAILCRHKFYESHNLS